MEKDFPERKRLNLTEKKLGRLKKIEVINIGDEVSVNRSYQIAKSFIPTFSVTCTENKDKISMSQLVKFQELITSRNYSFSSNEVKDYIEERLLRGVGKDFYKKFKEIFENEEYLFQFENSSNESIKKGINKKIMELLVLTMRAEIGEIKIQKNLEENE